MNEFVMRYSPFVRYYSKDSLFPVRCNACTYADSEDIFYKWQMHTFEYMSREFCLFNIIKLFYSYIIKYFFSYYFQ